MVGNKAEGSVSNSADIPKDIGQIKKAGADLTQVFDQVGASEAEDARLVAAVLKGLQRALRKVGALLDLEAGESKRLLRMHVTSTLMP